MDPTELTPDGNLARRRWLRILAFVVGALVALNLAAGPYLSRSDPKSEASIVTEKWRTLQQTESIDWLILGDSTCGRGVDAAVLAEKLGGTAVNACTVFGWVVLDSPWMLEVYLDSHPPPKNVILIHSHRTWHRQLEIGLLADVPLPWRHWEQLTPSIVLPEEEQHELWISRFLPLYRAIFRSEPRATAAEDLEESIEQRKEFLHSGDRTVQLINLASMARVTQQSMTEGFNLYLVNAPLAREVGDDPAFIEYFPIVESVYKKSANFAESVHYLDAQYLFDADEMTTVDHLGQRAKRRYTELIAEEISKSATATASAN